MLKMQLAQHQSLPTSFNRNLRFSAATRKPAQNLIYARYRRLFFANGVGGFSRCMSREDAPCLYWVSRANESMRMMSKWTSHINGKIFPALARVLKPLYAPLNKHMFSQFRANPLRVTCVIALY